MRVTVLGKSPSYTDAGGACSGYLVEEDGVSVLLDCGNGVFGKMRTFVDYVDVDAVVISHLHADHFLDLVPFAYGLIYAPRQQPVPVDRWPGTDTPARPVLHAPKGAAEVFRRVTGAWGPEDLIEKAFDLREYDQGDVLEIGTLRVRFHQVPHFLPNTNAVEFSSTNGGGRMTYGADHSPTDELIDFARDTDLLLIEATLPRPERDGVRGHITPGRGRRARAPRQRAPGGARPHLRRARPPRGPRAARARRSARRSRSPPRATSTTLSSARRVAVRAHVLPRPVRELRADAPRGRRALRRGVRPAPPPRRVLARPSTSSTSATRRGRSSTPSSPGVNPDEVKVEVRGRELILVGRRLPPQAKGRLYQQLEIEHGSFRRVVPLGADVDADAATADYDDGILEVTLPLRTERPSSRSVPITRPRGRRS